MAMGRAITSFLVRRAVELLKITIRCFVRGVITINLHSEATDMKDNKRRLLLSLGGNTIKTQKAPAGSEGLGGSRFVKGSLT